jgi:SAM-dependent methyltransferase
MTLPSEFFRRHDEAPDALFYAVPRPSLHLDAAAATLLAGWYAELVPAGPLLDLCAGACSHVAGARDVVGVGLDAAGLRANPCLCEHHLHDLNANPKLPFEEGRFAAAMCNLSAQYLTRPAEVFREVARCLKPGAPFFVSFSNRMFPTKAVLAWRASDEAAHIRLVKTYFASAGAFSVPQERRHSPSTGTPLYLLWAVTAAESEGTPGPSAAHLS